MVYSRNATWHETWSYLEDGGCNGKQEQSAELSPPTRRTSGIYRKGILSEINHADKLIRSI